MDYSGSYGLVPLYQHFHLEAILRAALGLFVLAFPFMLPHIFSYIAIPRGYLGVRNEDIKPSDGTRILLHGLDASRLLPRDPHVSIWLLTSMPLVYQGNLGQTSVIGSCLMGYANGTTLIVWHYYMLRELHVYRQTSTWINANNLASTEDTCTLTIVSGST